MGAAFGMGAESRGILGYGVKQKSCATCDAAKRRGVRSPHLDHPEQCTRNWEQSSKAMEAYLGAQIFEEMPRRKKLRANPVVMDGDATTATAVDKRCSPAVKVGLKFLADVGHAVKAVPDKLAEAKKAMIAAEEAKVTPRERQLKVLRKLKVGELKEMLTHAGLETGGKKDVLMERLVDYKLGLEPKANTLPPATHPLPSSSSHPPPLPAAPIPSPIAAPAVDVQRLEPLVAVQPAADGDDVEVGVERAREVVYDDVEVGVEVAVGAAAGEVVRLEGGAGAPALPNIIATAPTPFPAPSHPHPQNK